MPRAHRSKACNQCRDRRVKCDETPVTCQQCRRLGLICSGPIQGSVIIDMTDKITKPRQRKKRDKPTVLVHEDAIKAQPDLQLKVLARVSRPVREPRHNADLDSPSSASALQIVLAPKQNPPETPRLDADAEKAIVAIRSQYKLPMLYQPSLAEAFDNAFVSHFVELNRSVRSYSPAVPFVAQLPGLHIKANSLALRLSIRAASMAFYAKVHGEAPILVDSYKWYTISLNSQRMALSRLDGKRSPNDEECLVPIILGLYEVYAGTTPTSVFQHLTAATKILEMRGPRDCTAGAAVFLFRALRVSDAHKAVVFNKPSIFSAQEWMNLPFVHLPKNAPQYLTDILLQIPGCIGRCEMRCSLTGFFSKPIPARIDLKPVRDRATKLLAELDDWAGQYPHLCASMPVSQVTTLEMRTIVANSPVSQSPALIVPDTFVALTAATYRAIHIILALLLDKLSPRISIASMLIDGSSTPADAIWRDLKQRATKHADEILSISTYMESTHPVGFDFLRSVFPLVIVAILGPHEEQKKIARQMLDRWGEKRGLGGLCGTWVDI